MLTKCVACGGEVARSAQTCPHCGAANPGLNAVEIAIARRQARFTTAKVAAGLAFWPGVALVAYPAFTGGSGEQFLQNWAIAKWLLGFGFLAYIAAEIDRNIFEHRLKKQASALREDSK